MPIPVIRVITHRRQLPMCTVELQRTQAALGGRAIEVAEDKVGNSSTGFLRFGCEIASTHHEK